MRGIVAALSTFVVLGAVVAANPRGRSDPSRPPASSQDSRALKMARRLSAMGTGRLQVREPHLDVRAALRYIKQRREAIPLPRGGNFNGLRLRKTFRVAPGELELVLQFNARCQWLRASVSEREAEAVFAEANSWPAPRTLPLVPYAKLLIDCQRLHVREVSWARQHGLVPSR